MDFYTTTSIVKEDTSKIKKEENGSHQSPAVTETKKHHHHRIKKLKRESAIFKSFKVRQTFQKDHTGNVINTSDADHRTASYLELFYDLIMAATFAKLGDSLGEALAEESGDKETMLTIFAFYFVSFYDIYICWLAVITFMNRFQSDGAYDNVLILLNIIFIGSCNLFLDAPFSSHEIIIGFASCLMCTQLTIALSYVFVCLHHKDFEKKQGHERDHEEQTFYFARNYAVDRIISVCWLLPIFFIPSEKYWYLNLIFLFMHGFQYNILILLFMTGIIQYFTKKKAFVPVNPKLVQERQGLIFIVALGEIVITSTLSDIEVDEPFTQMLFSIANVALGASMALTFCLMYFTLYDWPGEESCIVVIRHNAKKSIVWLNLNCILCMCVTLTGCVLKRSTAGSYTDSDKILLATSISLFIGILSLSDKLHVFPKIVEYGMFADLMAIILINIWAYGCQPYIPNANGGIVEQALSDENDDVGTEDNETTNGTIFVGAAPTLCVYLLILFLLATFRKTILPVYLTMAGKTAEVKAKQTHGHHKH